MNLGPLTNSGLAEENIYTYRLLQGDLILHILCPTWMLTNKETFKNYTIFTFEIIVFVLQAATLL